MRIFLYGMDLIDESLENLREAIETDDLDRAATYFLQCSSLCNMYFTLMSRHIEDTYEQKKENNFPDIIEDETGNDN